MSEPLPTILMVKPIKMEDTLAFHISYGDCTDGVDVDGLCDEHEVHYTMTVSGPRGMPIEFHLCGDKDAPSAVFVGPKPVFCSMIITTEDWGPFHCEDCATIICNWFSKSQASWEDEFERLNGSSGSGFSKRLN